MKAGLVITHVYFTFMATLLVEFGFPLLLLTVNALTVTE